MLPMHLLGFKEGFARFAPRAMASLPARCVLACGRMIWKPSRRWRTGAVTTAVLLACATMPLVAWGQSDDDRAGARAAASEGLKAFESKRWTEALDLFMRAESLIHAPPHLLYMARSHLQLGHLVKARELYLRIRTESIGPDKPKAFQDAKANAETELAALEPTVPNVKVLVTGAVQKPVSVTIDGVVMNTALIGVVHPIDPGQHTIVAAAEGMTNEAATITIKRGATETVTLQLKPAPGASQAPVPASTPSAVSTAPIAQGAPAASPPTAMAPSATSTEPLPSDQKTNPLRIASYPTMALGLVGAGVGVAFLVVGNGKKSDADALCNGPGGICPYRQKDAVNQLDSDAKSALALSTAGLIVGGVALAAGATLFFVSGDKESSLAHAAAGPRVVPWIGVGSAGIRGAF